MSKSTEKAYHHKSINSRIKAKGLKLEFDNLLTHLHHPNSTKEFQESEEPDAVQVSEYWGKKNDLSKDLKISFEFYPPRSKVSKQSLKKTYNTLNKINPDYFSVTFGALGSSQSSTFDTVENISQETKVPVMPHISCIRMTRVQVIKLLNQYKNQGVSQLMVLKGDIPERMLNSGDFTYAADLVRFIRERYDDFEIHVAAYPEKHPQSDCVAKDIDFFVDKVHSGATHATTQFFYNSDAYFHFIDELQKRNIDIPITPGIMPITNFEKLTNFSKTCGAEIPAWILNHLELYKNDSESLIEFGEDIVNEMCQKLKQNGVNSFHFYSMNQSEPVLSLSKNLM